MKQAFAIILMAFTFVACKKEKTISAPQPEKTIIGLWKGKYGTAANIPNSGYSMLFRSNGTVRVFDGTDTTVASKAEGTYIVTGNTVNTTYRFISNNNMFSTNSILASDKTKMQGTWGDGTNTSGKGTFIIDKQE